jgi:acetamidase/formamidase
MDIRHLQPTCYYNTFGSHPAAWVILPGETIVTTTVDAHGFDANGESVCDGPNPQTGPFYIEGAQPNDTLVVRLLEMGPNRSSGWSYSGLAAHTVEPECARLLGGGRKIEWQFAADGQTAHLSDPGQLGRLEGLELPIAPMLGCLGVAPRLGQSISSATSGSYGGNMDYRGVRAGTTLYFPVAVPGALLFLGDGHALQGDGEISGTGIETSFKVRFQVEVIKNKVISWPRGENEGEIFTIGNARPLEQALQHATSEMLAWLEVDYGLSSEQAGTLLGMCARYDLGNIFDPAYTMVCKLPKAVMEKVL